MLFTWGLCHHILHPKRVWRLHGLCISNPKGAWRLYYLWSWFFLTCWHAGFVYTQLNSGLGEYLGCDENVRGGQSLANEPSLMCRFSFSYISVAVGFCCLCVFFQLFIFLNCPNPSIYRGWIGVSHDIASVVQHFSVKITLLVGFIMTWSDAQVVSCDTGNVAWASCGASTSFLPLLDFYLRMLGSFELSNVLRSRRTQCWCCCEFGSCEEWGVYMLTSSYS